MEYGSDADKQAALDRIHATFQEDPTFGYARLLAERYGIASADDDESIFAVAFERALSTRDHDRLATLATQYPKLEALTLLARAALGDDEAAWTAAMLLNEAPRQTELAPVRFLRHRLNQLFDGVLRQNVMIIVSANDNLIRHSLRDATEATFDTFALAA